MSKQKKKLSLKQKAAKRLRRLEYETVFMNGKQKRVKRAPTIDGMSVEDFIASVVIRVDLLDLTNPQIFDGVCLMRQTVQSMDHYQ